jgi:hypothetical protein
VYTEFVAGVAMTDDAAASATEPPFHEAIYSGAIGLFRDLPPMRDIVAYARDLVQAGCAPYPPEHVHRHLTPQELQARFLTLQREYGRSGEADRLWRALFESVGLRPDALARDRLILRFQPPHAEGTAPWSGRSVSTLGFHRPTPVRISIWRRPCAASARGSPGMRATSCRSCSTASTRARGSRW